jgi:hypothetical protein
MAHLFAPRRTSPKLPIFFNVEGVVGAAPSQNRREDVLLVQFFLSLLVKEFSMSAENSRVFSAVKLTGALDQSTTEAIKAFQKAVQGAPGSRTVVDSRVSPAVEGYAYGKGAPWTITELNIVTKDHFPDVWPRIDLIVGCPAELKNMVKREVVGATP